MSSPTSIVFPMSKVAPHPSEESEHGVEFLSSEDPVGFADLFVAQKRCQSDVEQVKFALKNGTPAQRSSLARKFIPSLEAAREWTLRSDLIRALVSPADAGAETLENATWILSSSPDASSRDAALAQACCERLAALPHKKPNLLLARAAVLAASGDFEKDAAPAREAAALNPSDQSPEERAAAMAEAFKDGELLLQGLIAQ